LLKEGVNGWDWHKPICSYGDVLEFLEAKFELFFLKVVQVGLVFAGGLGCFNESLSHAIVRVYKNSQTL
jgi:hypothetical protein